MKKAVAVYPGTFDPPTYGHLDIIKRVSSVFGRVIVAVSSVSGKDTWFSADERVNMLSVVTKEIKNVKVERFSGLLVDFVKKKKAGVVVRGLRALSDFEYEFQMALTNRALAPGVETLFMMTHEKYAYISSSLIKEIYALGGGLKGFVPPAVEKRMKKRTY